MAAEFAGPAIGAILITNCKIKILSLGTAPAKRSVSRRLGEPGSCGWHPVGAGRPHRLGFGPDMGSLPMENTLLIGLSRQIALQRELDVVANNVANMNTTGYKADGAIFEEYLMPTAQAAGFQGADRRVSYVQDRATWRDFGAGPIRPTGNPLDVAIDGDAFFVV